MGVPDYLCLRRKKGLSTIGNRCLLVIDEDRMVLENNEGIDGLSLRSVAARSTINDSVMFYKVEIISYFNFVKCPYIITSK